MSHPEAILITCVDYRLHQRKDGRNYVADFMKSMNMDCYLSLRAGGVRDIINSAKANDESHETIFRDARIAEKLHSSYMYRIVLMNHEGCGAYSGFTREEEIEQHHSDLKKAKEIISRLFPFKEVRLYFAELKPGTEDEYEIKEIPE